MTRALICTGVLGGGTAIVFALALAVSLAFPHGSVVHAGWNGGWAQPMIANDLMVRGGDLMVEQVAPPPVVEVPATIESPAPVEPEP
jgi:hypothetical protein